MSDVESFVRFCESEFGIAVMDREAAYLERFLDPGDRVLDVGAGIGSIEERFPAYDVVGLDVSEAMVRTAHERTDAPFLLGDARVLPIADDAVDVVFFVATLEFVPEVEGALAEAVRVLRPDGMLVALVLNADSAYVRSDLEREGSYVQRMVHRETDELASLVGEYVDARREYFLGIDDETVFETDDPAEAALLAIAGSPLGYPVNDDTNSMTDEFPTPLDVPKRYDEPSVFRPESLLDEARRQKDLPDEPVPPVCVLDPDGDLVRHLEETGAATRDATWPGYHTDLYRFEHAGETVGIVGRAVGAPFAVLVAEQLFASGCELLVSITSAGQIRPRDDPPYFVLIERACRDEGTSHHYRPPSEDATLEGGLRDSIEAACEDVSRPVYTGASWTTDAPYRETESAIDRARDAGVLAVEMEAAGLYSFAARRDVPVVCFAHVTNEMGTGEEDFEKGADEGSADALELLAATLEATDGIRSGRSRSQRG